MRRTRDTVYGLVRISRFPLSQFFLFFLGLLLASGVHVGLITLTRQLTENGFVLTIVPILYWGVVSLWMTLLTRYLMKNTFENRYRNWPQPPERWRKGISLSMCRRSTRRTGWTIWM